MDRFLTTSSTKDALGKLMHLATVARWDTATVLGMLCSRSCSPTQEHWRAVKKGRRYLKGTADLNIRLPANGQPKVIGCTDANWGQGSEGCPSTSGALFFYGGGATSWHSGKQTVAARSTTETENAAALPT
ncbi:hypothetical protein JRQ81_017153 [Phrynocephalus forsythii]|uniref:Uncharacterized protein n=1 Tax=Phrynocephalus forsythii TaxID=171643 RepID=A0A9Q1AZP5_9SAUR|nr:hypothetical protein JRQ81_017153 [Phrynocephalus forsythii]